MKSEGRYCGSAEFGSPLYCGPWTWWYDNGVKAREVRYVDGVQQGLAREWNAQGKRSKTGALALIDEAATLKVQEAERAAQPDTSRWQAVPGGFGATQHVYGRFLEGILVTQQYLGMTHDGAVVVQDFYEFDVINLYDRNVFETADLADLWPGEDETESWPRDKITDPYVALERRDGDSSNASWHIPAVAEGPLVVWYAGTPGQQQRLLAGAYVNGKPEGMWRMWWNDGTLWEESAYATGKRTGTWAQWDQEGRKV